MKRLTLEIELNEIGRVTRIYCPELDVADHKEWYSIEEAVTDLFEYWNKQKLVNALPNVKRKGTE